jgi:hypothetical protein
VGKSNKKSQRMNKSYSGVLTDVRRVLPDVQYKSAKEIWRDMDGLWSPTTVRQALSKLETLGEIVSKQEPAPQGFRRLWKKA